MTRWPLLDTVVLTVACGAALVPLLPVFGLAALLAPVLGGLAIGVVVATLGARWRWGAAVTVATAMAGAVLVGPALATPDLTVARAWPTLAGAQAVLAGVVTSWKQVLTLSPELGQAGNALVAPFVLALATSLGALTVAGRARGRAGAWAALVPVGGYVLAVLLGTKVAVAPVGVGVGLAVGLGTWAAARFGTLAPRRLLALVAVVGVMTALGAVTGPFVAEQRPRYVLRDEIVPPFDPADEASPLSAYRQFVVEWETTELLTVRGLPEGARVRLATMDAYDGVIWDVAGAEAAQGSGTFRRVGSQVDSRDLRGTTATVELEAGRLPFVWLPTVGWTEQVSFPDDDLRGDLRYNEATGTAALVGGVPEGLTWTADVVVPERVDPAGLASNVSVGSVVLPEPRSVPDAVQQAALEAAGTGAGAGAIAVALTDTLRDGWFSHGQTDKGEATSASGHGADRMTTLLTSELMVGDAEQYASAMALMARSLGLPARVVLGFVPDEQAPEITFTGADATAWVEVAYEGYGWVVYDPTPPESRTPDQDVPEEAEEPEPQVQQPPPPAAEEATPPEDDTEQPATQDREGQPQPSRLWEVVRQVALVGGIPLLLLVGPPLLVAAVKRRRRRLRARAADRVERVVGGWHELCDQALDLGRGLPEQATRRETAVALAGAFSPRTRTGDQPAPGRRTAGIGGPVATLASRADAVVFSGRTPTDAETAAYWAQVDSAVAAMRAAVPRRTRWRARWRVASLRRRAR